MRVLEWLLCRSKEMKGGEHCSSLSRRNGEEGGSDSVRHVGLEVPSGERRGGGGKQSQRWGCDMHGGVGY
jgi:hypothetical protein